MRVVLQRVSNASVTVRGQMIARIGHGLLLLVASGTDDGPDEPQRLADKIFGLRVFSDFEFEFRMALANHRLAADIESIAFITDEEHTFLSSTTVREIASLGGDVSSMVPPHVEAALKKKVLERGDQLLNPFGIKV